MFSSDSILRIFLRFGQLLHPLDSISFRYSVIIRSKKLLALRLAHSRVRRSRIPNHLRSFRKRFGLSQAELAVLIGCEDATKISHYERFKRVPGLEIVLRLQALFGVTVTELFPGLAHDAEQDVRRKLKRFAARLSKVKTKTSKLQAFLTLPGCLYEEKERKK